MTADVDTPLAGEAADNRGRFDTMPMRRLVDASRNRPIIDVRELWQYREAILLMVMRDLRIKYRQTYLGVTWAILQPLIGLGVFTFVFGKLVGVSTAGVSYPLFVITGLVPWTFFSRAVVMITNSLIHNQELVKKVYLPRAALPVAAMMSFFVDLMIGMVVVVVTMVVTMTLPAPQIVLLPVFLAVMVAATLGIGLFSAATNARFRDAGHIVPFIIQTMLFLTPVAYPTSLVPPLLQPVFALNPMVGAIDGIRWAILGTPASPLLIFISTVSAVFCLVIGAVWFARQEDYFADVI
jgi:lipopolysaccharide transport system permease protein